MEGGGTEVKKQAETQIRLEGSDGDSFIIKSSDLHTSGMIKEMIDDGIGIGIEESTAEIETITIPGVSTCTLRKVVEWAKYHKDDLPYVAPERDGDNPLPTNGICLWDKQFLNVEIELVVELLMAANYLEIPALMEICSKHIAIMVKNKPVQEIRRILSIADDWSFPEAVQIRKENQFIETPEKRPSGSDKPN